MKSRDIRSAIGTPRHLLVLLAIFVRRVETVKQSLLAAATDVGQFWGLLLPIYGALRFLEGKNHKTVVIFGTAALPLWRSQCLILPYGAADTLQILCKKTKLFLGLSLSLRDSWLD